MSEISPLNEAELGVTLGTSTDHRMGFVPLKVEREGFYGVDLSDVQEALYQLNVDPSDQVVMYFRTGTNVNTQAHNNQTESNAVYTFADRGIAVSMANFAVAVDGEEIDVTKSEFTFLALLARRAGEVVTKREIMRELWGREDIELLNPINHHLTRIRRKLNGYGDIKRGAILSIPAQGYLARTTLNPKP
jgi:DNA-binding winged helix-turn-helix (wHTH) protein